jgi:hypothetical protein
VECDTDAKQFFLPTLVIHGVADPMCDVSGGPATADAIPGAELVLIEGMGTQPAARVAAAVGRPYRAVRLARRAGLNIMPSDGQKRIIRIYSNPSSVVDRIRILDFIATS